MTRPGSALVLIAALLAGTLAAAHAAEPARLEVALTFDDLPLNGTPPAGVSRAQIMRDTLAVLKQHRVPPSYGFINASALENDPDAALALQLWVQAGNPLGNHTYSHRNLDKISVDDFTREILRNEPVLELLMPPGGAHDFRWLRYPFLHEGDTLDKRRGVRAFLASHGYRVAQTTLDYEDYMWNSAYARCLDRKDTAAIAWLRESYLATAEEWMRVERDLSRRIWGRDIHHVLLLHQGAFSATILPDLFALLKRQGYEFVTLEEAQSDPVYAQDPDVAVPGGGTLVEHVMAKRGIDWPPITPKPLDKVDATCR